jgi:hypothetical protein
MTPLYGEAWTTRRRLLLRIAKFWKESCLEYYKVGVREVAEDKILEGELPGVLQSWSSRGSRGQNR